MQLGDFLDNVFFRSLLQIYDSIFSAALSVFEPGAAVIVFSVALNVALLPLYYQMESLGKASRVARAEMNQEIARIKAYYRGRERYFYVRTIHRQFGYKPWAVVLASGDLYLQILIFATVYRYLSHHPALEGAEFGAIENLSQPDQLLFGMSLLPILMTVLNVGSALLYGGDRSKRAQSFLLALVFLVLLYRSPASLVLYWTTNNACSLLRNFVEKKLVPKLPSRLSLLVAEAARQE
jgi:membrane protein insertase Oxa1/YidC/SpoIIIJ